jgi:hypothetical protein
MPITEGDPTIKKLATIIAASCLLTSVGTFAATGGGVHSMPTNGTRTHQTPTTTTSSTVRGPAMTGQPKASCQSISPSNYPGNSSSAPGSPFNETNGKAGGNYAGSQPQNSRNTASVSQYDSACAHSH